MEIFETNDGSHSILMPDLGVSYHSRHGAITETQHVFLEHGLRFWLGKNPEARKFSVLETGFGTGLNAFMTYLESFSLEKEIDYTTLELFPIHSEIVGALNFHEQLGVPHEQQVFLNMHSCIWEEPHTIGTGFHFTKQRCSIEHIDFENQFDVVYFDAFAPQAQPELWTPAVFKRYARALRSGGVLVTYCAQGEFRRSLKSAGFLVEKLPGPPGKREMTRAITSY